MESKKVSKGKVSQLAEKATWSELSKEERDLVFQKIQEDPPDEHIATWIYIVGRLGAEQYRKIVEKYLYYPENPDASQEAIHVLCGYWGYTQDYLEEVKTFIRGVAWDDTDDIRLRTMSCVGSFLAEHLNTKSFNKELLQLLLDVFEGLGTNAEILEQAPYARTLIRACAYQEIAVSVGTKRYELPYIELTESMVEKNTYDQSILQKAYQLIKNN